MDTDYSIDLPAVFAVIDSAEVMAFRSVTISRRFLFDHNGITGADYRTPWERPPEAG